MFSLLFAILKFAVSPPMTLQELKQFLPYFPPLTLTPTLWMCLPLTLFPNRQYCHPQTSLLVPHYWWILSVRLQGGWTIFMLIRNCITCPGFRFQSLAHFFLAGSGYSGRCLRVDIDWACCCPFQGLVFFSFWPFWFFLSVFPVPSPLDECKPLFLSCGSPRALSSRPSPGP